jgi:hypothetical protein
MTIFALALGQAGCGDDKNETTTSETTPATSSATEPAGSTSTDPTNGSTTDTPTTTASSTDPTNGTTTTDPTNGTTTTDPTNGSTTDPTNGSTTAPDSTGGVEPDTKWPPPDVDMPNMPCPEGYVAASFVEGGLVCAPKCSGPGKICPSGDTGSAKGQCVFNPDSSGDMCKEGEMCMDMTEMCQPAGGGGFACLAPSSHCALLCNGGESCPAGMECMGKLVCQYPAP